MVRLERGRGETGAVPQFRAGAGKGGEEVDTILRNISYGISICLMVFRYVTGKHFFCQVVSIMMTDGTVVQTRRPWRFCRLFSLFIRVNKMLIEEGRDKKQQ